MSHVTTINLHITDLDCLRKAAEDCGLVFRLGQTSYKWFGHHVGDYPLPQGFTQADLGRCEHALAINSNKGAYEVGITKRRDGKPGYTLLWDFWAGGHGLQQLIGNGGVHLVDSYAARVAEKKLKAKGYRTTIIKTETGLRVRATR